MKNKHFWFMLACCLVPLVGLAVAWFLGVSLSTLGIVLILLVCPLSHLLFMRGMEHGKAQAEVAKADEKESRGSSCH